MVEITYGLTIGDNHSSGPTFATQAEADTAGQAIADAEQVEVTVLRFEAARGDGVFTDIELLHVLRAAGPEGGP
jgi:hypothetical protein